MVSIIDDIYMWGVISSNTNSSLSLYWFIRYLCRIYGRGSSAMLPTVKTVQLMKQEHHAEHMANNFCHTRLILFGVTLVGRSQLMSEQ